VNDDAGGFAYAAIWEGIAEIAPDRLAIACGDTHLSFGELDARADRVARVLAAGGLVAGDKVAIELVNGPAYLEVFYGALKIGCVPVNVNYRYVDAELVYLLDNAEARALVFHSDYAATVAAALPQLATPPAVLLRVERAPGPAVPGEEAYEQALARVPAGRVPRTREPSPDDLIFVYTGGTTGMPKGVMWRGDDLYRSLWVGSRGNKPMTDPLDAVRAGKRAVTTLPASPLMHGTALWMALSALAGGGTVVLVDDPKLDSDAVWSAVERERVGLLAIVGDAFARPLLAALDAAPGRWDLSSLAAIMSSGVMWSPETKQAMLAHLPHTQLIDSLGSSEGLMARSITTAADAEISRARFAVNERIKVLVDDPDTGAVREAVAGSGDVGLLAVGGYLPVGYWRDPVKSAATFREFEGRRYSVPGDHATVGDDGTIQLLGRGSVCINTGGEKVFPEEVEEIVKAHPGVFDCICVGVPDDRWGEMVVALVQRRDPSGDEPTGAQLTEFCRDRMAGYKRPKHFLFEPTLQRSPSGKADYRLLRTLAADALARTG
jgi:3-oxocholest-4-en-26-oate---CoA ligase